MCSCFMDLLKYNQNLRDSTCDECKHKHKEKPTVIKVINHPQKMHITFS